MIISPAELEITTSNVENQVNGARYRLEYGSFFPALDGNEFWDISRVSAVCENLSLSRRAYFAPENILLNGLHILEAEALTHLQETLGYLEPQEQNLVWKSVGFALKAHALQVRKSGEPYSVHILAVVQTLVDQKLDAITVAAGALHDTVEDCPAISERSAFISILQQIFGQEVLEPVHLITKIQDIRKLHAVNGDEAEWIKLLYQAIEMVPKKDTTSEEQIDELYRLQLITSLMIPDETNDSVSTPFMLSRHEIAALRAVLVKLADRLHNMQTLSVMSAKSQLKNSLETREIYVKIAQKLGLWKIAVELADLSAQYLQPHLVEQLRQYQLLAEELLSAPLPLVELVNFLLPESTDRDLVTTQCVVPSAAAMQAIGEPFLTLDIGVQTQPLDTPDQNADVLEHIATAVTSHLREHYGHKKKFLFPNLPTVMELMKSQTLNTFSFFIPSPLELHAKVKLLRINITTETVVEQENASIVPLLQPFADAEDQELAFEKWQGIQDHTAEYREKFSKLFATFTSDELLLALTQRVPVGMMLVVGAPPVTKGGRERPKVPWLMPQQATIADFIQSITSLRKKRVRSVTINGLVATDLHLPLMPFDEITILTV